MADIFEIMTLGEYADIKKINSGNKITDHYHESTANVKIRDVYFPKSQAELAGTSDQEWGYALPPVLIPAELTMDDLIGMRLHYSGGVQYDMTGTHYEPSIATVDYISETERYGNRALYKMETLATVASVVLYDPKTGILLVEDDNNTIVTNLAETLGYDAASPDYNKLFEYLYSIMIGTWEPTEDSEEGGSGES